MKTKNFIFSLLFYLICMGGSFAQVEVSAWEIHRGNEGTVDFPTRTDEQRKEAFGKGSIPEKSDSGWELAKTQADGTVNYPDLGENVKRCAEQLDFTYFQTFVRVPDTGNLKSFTVSYDKADDGARIYFFNDKYPKGHYEEASDLLRNTANYKIVNLKDQLANGENRIVIVQYNQCTKNSILGIRIQVDNKEVTPKVLPSRFKLHAYSISGNRVEKGSNHWMGFDEKAQKVNAANNNAKYFDGKIVSPQNATVMEFERVDIDKEKGIIMLKLANNPDPKVDLYLQVGNDKNVTLYPGTAKSGRGYFYVRVPEEKEAGNLNFVSLETAGYPSDGGWFLRHEGYGLKVTPGDDNTRKDKVYRQDATWLFEPVK